jgi:hypothetical protein
MRSKPRRLFAILPYAVASPAPTQKSLWRLTGYLARHLFGRVQSPEPEQRGRAGGGSPTNCSYQFERLFYTSLVTGTWFP